MARIGMQAFGKEDSFVLLDQRSIAIVSDAS